jgi:hypothetical protein
MRAMLTTRIDMALIWMFVGHCILSLCTSILDCVVVTHRQPLRHLCPYTASGRYPGPVLISCVQARMKLTDVASLSDRSATVVWIYPDYERSLYLTLFQADLTHTTIRWTVTSFFMGISFALLGFSFQTSFSFISALAIRVSAIAIYWFAYILYLHYYDYNVFLRDYLLKMELSGVWDLMLH